MTTGCRTGNNARPSFLVRQTRIIATPSRSTATAAPEDPLAASAMARKIPISGNGSGIRQVRLSNQMKEMTTTAGNIVMTST